jgi:hypothetical protein
MTSVARVAVAVVALALAIPAAASANGRAPLTNGVHFEPGDNQSIYVATTFGLLISHDDGCTFRWVCEQNLGYGGTYDPKYSIAADGTIFATTYAGLSVSRDGGCSFNFATGSGTAGPGSGASLDGVWIDALDIGPTGEVWIGTADSGHPNDVYRSTDDGQTFFGRGMLSPTIWWKSVKVAPTDPMRVYIGGYQVAGTYADGGTIPPTAHLLRSDDDGDTWTESALAGVQFGPTPLVHVMAVDPNNEDILYVLSDAANPPTGDLLYRSTDGGTTLSLVLTSTDPIRDVVIRDRQTVVVATTSGGSMSSDGGVTFAPITAAPQLECLGQRGDGQLFGCGANWQPDYLSIGRSSDALAWQKVFRFVNLEGPLSCPAGTMEHDVCDQQMWAGLQQQFGTTGPTCGPFATADGAPAPAHKSGGGCCDANDDTGGIAALLALTAAALLLVLRRRAG